jgi:DNA-binding MarR family transcriptional regulator
MALLDALSIAAEYELTNGNAIMLMLLLKEATPKTRFDGHAFLKATQCSRAAICRTFDVICIRGYAVRIRDDKDRRFIRAWLTAAGHRLVKELEAA